MGCRSLLRGSSQPSQQTQVSCTAGRFFINCVQGLWPEWKHFISLTRRMDPKRQGLYITESRGSGIYPGLYYLDLNLVCMRAKLLQLCLTLGTHQAPLSMGFSRQEQLSDSPCPPLGDLPNPEIKPLSLGSPTLVGRYFTTYATVAGQNFGLLCPSRPNKKI